MFLKPLRRRKGTKTSKEEEEEEEEEEEAYDDDDKDLAHGPSVRNTADTNKKKKKRKIFDKFFDDWRISFKTTSAFVILSSFFLLSLRGFNIDFRKGHRTTTTTTATTAVYAIGDIHGDEDVLRKLLFALKITDKVYFSAADDFEVMKARDGNEEIVLVQTGDVVDRGARSIEAFDLLRTIKNKKNTGIKVELLVGNHELMAIQSDYRFVSADELVNLGDRAVNEENLLEQSKIHQDSTVGRKALYKLGLLQWKKLFHFENEKFGREIREFGSVVTVQGEGNCKSAFAHAGILPEHLEQIDIELGEMLKNDVHSKNNKKNRSAIVTNIINEKYRSLTKGKQLTEYERFNVLPRWIESAEGVFWTREPPDATNANGGCEKIKQIVDFLDAKRLVIGHTVQPEGMRSLCDGYLVLIDSGMSYAYGGRMKEAFVCKGVNGVPMAVDVNGKSRKITA
jgi:hypothetical protein